DRGAGVRGEQGCNLTLSKAILARFYAIEIRAHGLDRCLCARTRKVEPHADRGEAAAVVIPPRAKPLIEGKVFYQFVWVDRHGAAHKKTRIDKSYSASVPGFPQPKDRNSR